MSAGVPRLCIATYSSPSCPTSGSMAGSSSPADMSLTMNGPTVSKQRSTTEAQ